MRFDKKNFFLKTLIFDGMATLLSGVLVVVILLVGRVMPAGTCVSHVDVNADGRCDRCRQSVIVNVDIFAINDLHGKFEDSSTQPGVDELTMYFKEQNAVNQYTLYLSSGDMWQGSSASNETEGRIIIDWMEALDFEEMTLGNHEFDWGEDVIAQNAAYANFPFLAINVYNLETHERVDYCRPSVLVERGDAKIGIIGAVGDCYSSIAADRTENIYFVTGNALTKLIKEESENLRKQGADYVILSIHDGYDGSFDDETVIIDRRLAQYYDVSLSAGYVDLVFEGHTHQHYVLKDSKGVYHLQDGGDNSGISHVSLAINVANDSGEVKEAEIVLSGKYRKCGADPLRDALLEKYSDILEPTKAVLGYASSPLDRDELRQMVAMLYYQKGVEVWGDNYNIVLGGGFMSARNPGYIAKGDVNYSMLQSIFPFDNELVLCSISGADLDRVFFKTTNDNYFFHCGEYAEKVYDNLDRTATYYVVTDTYSSTYEPNHMTEIERLGEEYYARDMLRDYILSGGLGDD